MPSIALVPVTDVLATKPSSSVSVAVDLTPTRALGVERGHLYLLLELPERFAPLGKNLLQIFSKTYYEKYAAEEAIVAFEKTLSAANATIRSFWRTQKKLPPREQFVFVVALFVENVLHLVQIGEAEVSLLRHGVFKRVGNVRSDQSDDIPNFSNIASGALQEGDTLLIANMHFATAIGQKKLKQVVAAHYPTTAVAHLREYFEEQGFAHQDLKAILIECTTGEEHGGAGGEASSEQLGGYPRGSVANNKAGTEKVIVERVDVAEVVEASSSTLDSLQGDLDSEGREDRVPRDEEELHPRQASSLREGFSRKQSSETSSLRREVPVRELPAREQSTTSHAISVDVERDEQRSLSSSERGEGGDDDDFFLDRGGADEGSDEVTFDNSTPAPYVRKQKHQVVARDRAPWWQSMIAWFGGAKQGGEQGAAPRRVSARTTRKGLPILKRGMREMASEQGFKRHHLYLLLSVVSVLFLVTILYTTFRIQQQNEEIKTFYADAEGFYTSALRSIEDEDIPEARKWLARALTATEHVLERQDDYEEAQNLRTTINAKLDDIDGILRFSSLMPVVAKEDFPHSPDDVRTLLPVGGDMYLLDHDDNRLFFYDMEEDAVRTKVEQLPSQAQNPVAAAAIDLTLYIYTRDGVLSAYATETERFGTLAVNYGDEWKPAEQIYSYGSNLYFFDRGHDQLWRYKNVTEPASRYFQGVDISLADTVSLAIDGDVYELKEDGRLLRHTQTKKPDRSFVVTALSPELENPTALETSFGDEKAIYVAEPSKNRIVSIDKDGRFQKQYVWEDLSIDDIPDMYVDYSARILYFLGDNELYKIEL